VLHKAALLPPHLSGMWGEAPPWSGGLSPSTTAAQGARTCV
jgi:hypothetical protein